VPEGSAQGDPFNTDYAAGDGRILIGQFSSADAERFSVFMTIEYRSEGVLQQAEIVSVFGHDPCIPGAGALPPLGLAGLLGSWRRCRKA